MAILSEIHYEISNKKQKQNGFQKTVDVIIYEQV
jgi:hypothetical protein